MLVLVCKKDNEDMWIMVFLDIIFSTFEADI